MVHSDFIFSQHFELGFLLAVVYFVTGCLAAKGVILLLDAYQLKVLQKLTVLQGVC